MSIRSSSSSSSSSRVGGGGNSSTATTTLTAIDTTVTTTTTDTDTSSVAQLAQASPNLEALLVRMTQDGCKIVGPLQEGVRSSERLEEHFSLVFKRLGVDHLVHIVEKVLAMCKCSETMFSSFLLCPFYCILLFVSGQS
jgi:hypothetical protein